MGEGKPENNNVFKTGPASEPEFFGSWVIMVRPDLNRIRSSLLRLN